MFWPCHLGPEHLPHILEGHIRRLFKMVRNTYLKLISSLFSMSAYQGTNKYSVLVVTSSFCFSLVVSRSHLWCPQIHLALKFGSYLLLPHKWACLSLSGILSTKESVVKSLQPFHYEPFQQFLIFL